MGGKFHLKLNTDERPIANKYREGKMKRTLKRESKELEIVWRVTVFEQCGGGPLEVLARGLARVSIPVRVNFPWAKVLWRRWRASARVIALLCPVWGRLRPKEAFTPRVSLLQDMNEMLKITPS